MKDLQLSNSCVNCENLLMNSICSFHNLEVSEKYTCENFHEKQDKEPKLPFCYFSPMRIYKQSNHSTIVHMLLFPDYQNQMIHIQE